MIVWHTMGLEKYTSGKTGLCNRKFQYLIQEIFSFEEVLYDFFSNYSLLINTFKHQNDLLQIYLFYVKNVMEAAESSRLQGMGT